MFDHCYYLDIRTSEQSTSGFPIEIGVVGALTSLSMVIRQPEGLSKAAQNKSGANISSLVDDGRTTKDIAQALNEKFAGIVVFCDTQIDIDMINQLFVEAEALPLFQIALLKDGWVDDMVNDYDKLILKYLADNNHVDAKPALKGAAAMRFAHANMIPL